MRKGVFLKWMVLVPIALSLLFGCGGKGKDIKKVEPDPERLYKEGLTRFNKRDYSEALKKFEELKSSYPDSPPFTILAELKVGDCNFQLKEYPLAIAAYEEFKKIHPTHEEIPYVQFQIAMAYFNQMLSLDRDQTFTKKALSSFDYLIANYPPSLFTEKAKEKIRVCLKRLADHEFYVGNYYYRYKMFQAAASRFEGLLVKFPKEPREDETLYLLGKSYLELEQWEKADNVFMKIVVEYPKSSRYKEARAILDKGIAEKKASVQKTKTKESKKKGEITEAEPEGIALVKFEEEGKQPVSLKGEKRVEPKKEEERVAPPPVTSESAKAVPPKEETKTPIAPVTVEPMQEERIQAIPPSQEAKKVVSPEASEPLQADRTQAISPSPEAKKGEPIISIEPMQEDRTKAIPPSQEAKKVVSPEASEPPQADRTQAISPSPEAKKGEPIISVEPMKEDRTSVPQTSPPPKTEAKKEAKSEAKKEVKPSEEKRTAAFMGSPTSSKEKEKVKKTVPPEAKEAKLGDKSQPIDITSDKVEAYWKENLIVFKGNVIARQKDIVIYADSVEAVVVEDGKGIEKVIAGGNVKIQQGLRVANCQKAVFYNVEQKVVMTGDPKVSEGGNIVSGDEIVFDIEKDRVEVKGGSSGRGKAKIQPGKEIEILK
jgi:outer membrane protein assembly factor BamD